MLNNFCKAVVEIWKLQQKKLYAVGLIAAGFFRRNAGGEDAAEFLPRSELRSASGRPTPIRAWTAPFHHTQASRRSEAETGQFPSKWFRAKFRISHIKNFQNFLSQTEALPRGFFGKSNLVDPGGIEPPSSGCKPDALPLSYRPSLRN